MADAKRRKSRRSERASAVIYASWIIKARSDFVNSAGDKSMTEFRFGPTDPR